MARIKLKNISQNNLISEFKISTKLSYARIAQLFGIQNRTLLYWRKDKYFIEKKAFKKMASILKKKIDFEEMPEYWNSKKAGQIGAEKIIKLYGSPGTKEGRAKGGKKTYYQFQKNPELARKKGFIMEKNIVYPNESKELAEVVGIMLGDGHINKYQMEIALNRITDEKYSYHIEKLFYSLFQLKFSRKIRGNCLTLTISSKKLIDFLLKKGLAIGNKVKNQVDVPKWIQQNTEYGKACLRGLVDTDGSVYRDKKTYASKVSYYLVINFTNRSIPILKFAEKTLINNGFHPIKGIYTINLKKRAEIWKYFQEIGTSNFKHMEKLVIFKGQDKERYQSGRNGAVSKAA